MRFVVLIALRGVAAFVAATVLMVPLGLPAAGQDERSAKDLAEQLGSVDLQERRDAAYALADLGAEAQPALDALIVALDDRDEQVWMQSAMAVARIGPAAAKASPALIKSLDTRDDQQRYRAAWVLSRLGREAIEPLKEAASSDVERVRVGALDAMGWMSDHRDELVPVLQGALDDDDQSVVRQAVDSLALLQAADVLCEVLDHEDSVIRATAVSGIAAADEIPAKAESRLLDLTEDEAPRVRQAAVVAVAASRLPRQTINNVILSAIQDADPLVRDGGIVAIKKRNAGGDEDLQQRLISLLDHDDQTVRDSAALAIGLIGSQAAAAVPALIDALKNENENEKAVATALRRIGAAAVDPLLQAASDEQQSRQQIASTLAGIGAVALPTLMRALESESNPPSIRAVAATALGQLDQTPSDALGPLLELLDSPEANLREAAVIAIANAKTLEEKYERRLQEARTDEDAGVRAAAIVAIAKTQSEPARVAEVLRDAVNDPNGEVRRGAVAAVADLGPDAAPLLAELIAALSDRDPTIRLKATEAIGGIGKDAGEASDALQPLLDDPESEIRIAALSAIQRIEVRSQELAAAIADLLQEPEAELQVTALQALSGMGNDASEYLDFVTSLTEHPRESVRGAALQTAANIAIDKKEIVPTLTNALRDEQWTVRRDAAFALGTVGSPAATPAVASLLELMESDLDRESVRNAIRQIDDADASSVPKLIEMLQSEDRGSRYYGSYLLGKVESASEQAITELRKIMETTESDRMRESLQKTIDRWEDN